MHETVNRSQKDQILLWWDLVALFRPNSLFAGHSKLSAQDLAARVASPPTENFENIQKVEEDMSLGACSLSPGSL